MYQSEFDEIETFSQTLSVLRQTVSDRDLLDRCEKYLADLVGLCKYANAPLEADPPAPEAPEPTQ
jgi:hypothetical protein